MFDKEEHIEFIDSINKEIHKFYEQGISSNDLIIIHVPERLFNLAQELLRSRTSDSNYIKFGGVLLLFLKNKDDEFESDLISGIGNAY